MSLENEAETPDNQHISDDQDQTVRRAESVFPVYSAILIGCLIAVFIGQLYADSITPIIEGVRSSLLLAGFVKQLFVEGQFWRILTGAALHGGLMHLAFNSYALYILGKLIETLSNRNHLAIVFLLSAIGGGVLSLIFLPDIPSIGASGGVIGFLGYLTIYGYKRRKLLSNAFLKNMLFNIGLVALFGISINFYAQFGQSDNVPMVDNFGHLGGLLTGAIYGVIQIPSDLYKDPRESNQITRILGWFSLGIFILTAIFSILILTGIIDVPFPLSLINE